MSLRLVTAAVLLASTAASAPRAGALEGKRIAVLEFMLEPGAKVQSPATLSDECRGALVDMTKQEGAFVITRENMLEMLKVTGGQCKEGECEVETARNLGVDLFVTGGISSIDGQLVLSLKAYETRKGSLLGQRRVSAPREMALLDLVRPATAALVHAAWGIGSERPAGATVQPPPRLGSFGEPGPDLAVNEGEEVLAKFESEPPGASVRLDGELLCRATPCSKRVAGGRREVVFEQERYAAARVSAVVGQGAVVRGTLTPKFGWLSIETDLPGVAITVDGAEVGRTPISALEVDEGTVEVAVADGCYARTGERLSLEAGERRTLRITERPRVAGLQVNAVDGDGNDLDVRVRVDGRELGSAGQVLKVPVCSRVVEVKLGRQDWRSELKLEEGKVTTLTARAERVARESAPLGYRMFKVEPSVFTAGEAPSGQWPAEPQGLPTAARRVRLAKPFSIGRTEVTQALYERVMGENPARDGRRFFGGKPGSSCARNRGLSLVDGRYPVICVSWEDAVRFCNRLSQLEGLTPAYRLSDGAWVRDTGADGYRLPTEDEWEYAALAGARTVFSGTSDPAALCGHSNGLTSETHAAGIAVKAQAQPCSDGWPGLAPVGSFAANAFGLHDMTGNVWEWVEDADTGQGRSFGIDDASRRPIRGGSWYNEWPRSRVSNRLAYPPSRRDDDLGFRIAR